MIKWQTNSNSQSSILHAQTQYRSVHVLGFITGEKTVENQDWAKAPLDRLAVTGRGPQAAGTLQVVGHWQAFSKAWQSHFHNWSIMICQVPSPNI